MDAPSPQATPTTSPATEPPGPAPIAAAAAPGIARRLAPLILIGVLGGGDAFLFQRDMNGREALRESESARDAAEHGVRDLTAQTETVRGDLERAKKEQARLEAQVQDAKRAGSEDSEKARAERAALEKKVAELADKLGESEAARDKAEKHARELDQVMAALAKKKLNARRLAGLEAPPRLDASVVSVDTAATPPILVLRVKDGTTGLEEGDVLYLLRGGASDERETGRARVERIDAERRLVQARVVRLDEGEKVVVGDRLTTVSLEK